MPIAVMSIIAIALSTPMLSASAVNTCPATHCRAEGDYLTTTRSGVQRDSIVGNPSVPDPANFFIAQPFWMVMDNGDQFEIGWIKGKLSGAGSFTSPTFYRCQKLGISSFCTTTGLGPAT